MVKNGRGEKMAKIENPKVFISYCWSNEEYINKR